MTHGAELEPRPFDDAGLERVRALLEIASRIADPGDELAREVAASIATESPLSREGIALALREHLETAASDEELGALARSVRSASRVWVVPSANVCTATLRATALAIAASPTVLVRRSRRESALARVLVRELGRSPRFARAQGSIALVDELRPSAGDAVHAYGSDASIETIRRALPSGVTLWAHGTGFGVAAIGPGDDLDESARALSRDVVPFDQAGCLSPRIAFVRGGAEIAERFAGALAAELDRAGRAIPRGAIDRGELARFEAVAETLGVVHRGEHGTVAVDPEPRALLLPPPTRAVLVVPASDPHAIARHLGSASRFLTCVGVASWPELAELAAGSFAGGSFPARVRIVPLGTMQRPPLDGPVDGRQLAPS